jgi:beta-lactamase class D
MLNRTLLLSRLAIGQVEAIVERFSVEDDWILSGKTGGAYPRGADGSLDRAQGHGWFVGWATKGETRAVFVRLTQDKVRDPVSSGIRARSAFLAEWPALAARLDRRRGRA